MKSVAPPVTLVVYGWRENEPGTLAWRFPNLAAAVGAVRALKNAVRWLIVKGRFGGDVEDARRRGLVLLEA